MTTSYDAIILGAGAAGMMCAAVAGQRGRRVLLVDHVARPGAKIVISGGGRCNFTNTGTVPDRFLSANPHFAKSALGRYTPADFIALVERHGIAWHEKTLGQLFCDGSAKQIVEMLVGECELGGVEWALGQPADVAHDGTGFRVTIGPRTVTAPALVIATGGPSIPKIGATDFSYRLAKQFGLKLVEPRPALVPLTLGPDEALFRELAGVAAEVVASAGKGSFREAALFTHRGLSGPAILQASSYWRHGDTVAIDFTPGRDPDWLVELKRTQPRASLRRSLGLPDRLAEALAGQLQVADRLADAPDKALRGAAERLATWPFRPNGSEGYAKAEVTVGGISTAELSSQTMEARRIPGLYAIGEAVDVTGWLGGYNFQWAWASGSATGNAL
ncbi:NAD(P)/FAD-dependent oxidoreductase [Sphingomonas mollis]|uniref:NAD(P)/FAD-dependent oxidoreductase n=1 Tax=Sphingomonas mollis TaxID=2795726 RepID=A0ABS0XS30_9SPHN|nr:NAD(P)/FAD-dependent oxidoreductase [Sphingomonas sp. BT553]MBJ6122836.1 NAD(P)/FAD-dependent oxidoreductase [Sphingomonas sp. BT553]